jgi:hypothetical protein
MDLSKEGKQKAAENYKMQKENILNTKKHSSEEYDEIDDLKFAEYYEQLKKDGTLEEKHKILLDYYMNPQHNYYDL